MRIVTWNVNSINCRLEQVGCLIDEYCPDAILLQEIKTVTERFPSEYFFDKGYNCAINGQKSYNGVAILSKHPIANVITSFCEQTDQQARYIECILDKIRIASIYVPNGREVASPHYLQKLEFLEFFTNYLKKEQHPNECFIVGGDFNIAINDNDVWDKELFNERLLFTTQERNSLGALLEKSGFVDSFDYIKQKGLLIDAQNKEPLQFEESFTWWDYRAGGFAKNHGIRLDYLLASPCTVNILKSITVLKKYRAKPRPSDHVPVMIEISV